MSNNNKKRAFASVLGTILATGLLALNPSLMENAQAQMYANEYGYDDSNYNSYYPEPKSSHTDIQKIKCVNSNLNVNGIDITEVPQNGPGLAAAANEGAGTEGANTQNGNGLADRSNVERNLVNICVNVNDNEQIKVTPSEEEEPPRTCETCFTTHLSLALQQYVLENAEQGDTFGEICNFLRQNENNPEESEIVFTDIGTIPGITPEQQRALFQCLVDYGVVDARAR